jgi:hypothetical protein
MTGAFGATPTDPVIAFSVDNTCAVPFGFAQGAISNNGQVCCLKYSRPRLDIALNTG